MIRKLHKIVIAHMVKEFVSSFFIENDFFHSMNQMIQANFDELKAIYKSKKKNIINQIENFYFREDHFFLKNMSLKIIQKFQMLLDNQKLLSIIPLLIFFNYCSIISSIRIVRAPPVLTN